MSQQIWPASSVAFPVLPGETGRVIPPKLDAQPIRDAFKRLEAALVAWGEVAARTAEAVANLTQRWSQSREVYVAGLEARYWVRGGLDTRYRDPEARDALVRDLMRGKELPPPCLLDAKERAQVATAFLAGWAQSYPEPPACACWMTDPSTWFTYYGAVEPGSQWEWNPDCPVHRARWADCQACGHPADPAGPQPCELGGLCSGKEWTSPW